MPGCRRGRGGVGDRPGERDDGAVRGVGDGPACSGDRGDRVADDPGRRPTGAPHRADGGVRRGRGGRRPRVGTGGRRGPYRRRSDYGGLGELDRWLGEVDRGRRLTADGPLDRVGDGLPGDGWNRGSGRDGDRCTDGRLLSMGSAGPFPLARRRLDAPERPGGTGTDACARPGFSRGRRWGADGDRSRARGRGRSRRGSEHHSGQSHRLQGGRGRLHEGGRGRPREKTARSRVGSALAHEVRQHRRRDQQDSAQGRGGGRQQCHRRGAGRRSGRRVPRRPRGGVARVVPAAALRDCPVGCAPASSCRCGVPSGRRAHERAFHAGSP
jgi:hypothetical protein